MDRKQGTEVAGVQVRGDGAERDTPGSQGVPDLRVCGICHALDSSKKWKMEDRGWWWSFGVSFEADGETTDQGWG